MQKRWTLPLTEPMGTISSRVDESTQQQIMDKQEQILGQFASQFRISYRFALLSHFKNSAESTVEQKLPTRKLPVAKPPSYPTRTGYMVKSPAPTSFFGNYKERFFVVGN